MTTSLLNRRPFGLRLAHAVTRITSSTRPMSIRPMSIRPILVSAPARPVGSSWT